MSESMSSEDSTQFKKQLIEFHILDEILPELQLEDDHLITFYKGQKFKIDLNNIDHLEIGVLNKKFIFNMSASAYQNFTNWMNLFYQPPQASRIDLFLPKAHAILAQSAGAIAGLYMIGYSIFHMTQSNTVPKCVKVLLDNTDACETELKKLNLSKDKIVVSSIAKEAALFNDIEKSYHCDYPKTHMLFSILNLAWLSLNKQKTLPSYCEGIQKLKDCVQKLPSNNSVRTQLYISSHEIILPYHRMPIAKDDSVNPPKSTDSDTKK